MQHLDEDILSMLAEYIFDFESFSDNTEAVSQADGVIRIIRRGAVRRLIAFATASNCEATMQKLKDVALNLNEADELIVFYTGNRSSNTKPEPLPGRSMLIAFYAVSVAWFLYSRLRDDQTEIGLHVCKEYSQGLAHQLKELELGNGSKHEDLLRRIFAFSFPSCIWKVDSNVRTVDGEKIRDILLRVRFNSRLNNYIRDSHRTANTIIVEAKNEKKNNGAAITQLEGYLGYHRTADVGILVTRKTLGKDLLSDTMRGRRERASSALIVPISDEQLEIILQNSAASTFEENEFLLIDWISCAIDNRP